MVYHHQVIRGQHIHWVTVDPGQLWHAIEGEIPCHHPPFLISSGGIPNNDHPVLAVLLRLPDLGNPDPPLLGQKRSVHIINLAMEDGFQHTLQHRRSQGTHFRIGNTAPINHLNILMVAPHLIGVDTAQPLGQIHIRSQFFH